MNNRKVFQQIFLSFSFLFLSVTLFAKQDRIWAPGDLPVPVLDSTGFIVDPENRIVEEWKNDMIGSRETYFFARYVEPICVNAYNIRQPDDVEAYADKLVELWDLEKKTNGRFILQLVCGSKEKIVFRVGSRLTDFYQTGYLNRLTTEIEAIHFEEAETGTGDFVAMQDLGDHIYENIMYDPAIITYEGNNAMHTFYPDKVSRSPRGYTAMSKSVYTGATDLVHPTDEAAISDRLSSYEEKNYFSGLTQAEIDENYNGINTYASYQLTSQVPNARETDGGHVTNPDGILTPFAVDTINNLLDQLENSLGYQVAVVCVNSIGENDPHEYGTELFNAWGIGQKDTENGLLMLFVNDQHDIEFITGRGTEGIFTDVNCRRIQEEEMVPYFKNNDFVTGMIRGTQAVCDFFNGTPPMYTAEPAVDYSSYYEEPVEPEVDYNFFESGIFYAYLWVAGLLSLGWVLMLFMAFFNRDLYKRYVMMKFFTLLIWPITFPIPFLLLYFSTKKLMERWRNTERFSEKNGELMHKLGDHDEDKHLQKGQISEEKVKSIDYDVWITIGASDVLILSYAKWFSKFVKCPNCKYKTYFQVYDKTISAATYDSSGTGERFHRCENCGHARTERYTIPKRTRPSNSSSSGGGYSSGGGSSYSSGGSSYGGGSSRGGGAGSRW